MKLRTHLFVLRSVDPATLTRWCRDCPLPERNQIHDVPERDNEEREAENRKVGERDE